MKRRYNNETKQWDIVLTEQEYLSLWNRTNFPVAPSMPHYPPLPNYPAYPSNPWTQTWCGVIQVGPIMNGGN